MQLQLQDFASNVEGDNVMQAGEITRVMNMWVLGLTGLSHYAIHLPRFILILESYLANRLAKAIKHSLLDTTSGQKGNWVAKEFYFEIQNYWLKYFHNNLVHVWISILIPHKYSNHTQMYVSVFSKYQGTKIELLMDRFSILIPLVCPQNTQETWIVDLFLLLH